MSRRATNRKSVKSSSMMDADEMRHHRHEKTLELRRATHNKDIEQRRRRLACNTSKIPSFASRRSAANASRPACTTMLPLLLGRLSDEEQCHAEPHAWLAYTRSLREVLSATNGHLPASEVTSVPAVLSRLIQGLRAPDAELVYESAWALANLLAEPKAVSMLVEGGVARELISVLNSTTHVEIQSQCLWAMRNIASDNETSNVNQYRQMMLENNDILRHVHSILQRPHQVEVDDLETACGLLANLAKHQGAFECFKPLLNAIVPLLHDTQIECVGVQLQSLMLRLTKDAGPRDFSHRLEYLVAYDGGAIPQALVQMLKHDKLSVRMLSMHVLARFACGGVEDLRTLHRLNLLGHIKLLLLGARTDTEIKMAFFIVANLAASSSGDQVSLVMHQGIHAIAIDKLRRSPKDDVRREAAYVISNLAMSYNNAYVRVLVQQGAIKALSNELESADSEMAQQCLSALEAILITGKMYADNYNAAHEDADQEVGNPYLVHMEAAGACDTIQNMQNHKSDAIAKHANNVVALFGDAYEFSEVQEEPCHLDASGTMMF